MARRGVDVLLSSTPENIYYGSGYQSYGFHSCHFLVIPIDKEPFLILRFFESALARRFAWLDDVISWDDDDDPVEVTASELRRRGLAGKAIAVEEAGPFFRVATYRGLKAELGELVDGSGIIESARLLKSKQELAYMREAAKLTDLGVAAALRDIRAGCTDNSVAANVFEAMTRGGSEYLTRDPVICAGDHAGIGHSCYMRRTISDGDAVLMEFSGVYNRYYSPIMRSAVVGKPSAEILRSHSVCSDALSAALACLKPGRSFDEVVSAVRRVIDGAGLWEYFRRRPGYSVGIGFSSWVESGVAVLKKNDFTELRPGMCFHIPIAIRFYGRTGTGVSETVHITDTGYEVLGTSPRDLHHC